MSHGVGVPPFGNLMLTRVGLGGRSFVHASDIQLLDTATIDLILGWAPSRVLAAGPPLYESGLDAGKSAPAPEPTPDAWPAGSRP